MKQQIYESELFIVINDNLKMFARFFYIKWEEGEREQDSGETERERACARGRALWGEEDSISNKIYF